MLHTSDFDFELPPELIASHPLERRDASRMLVVQSSPPLEGCPQGGVVRDTVNYRTLPFNPNLKQRARELRRAGSLPEALLWNEIKNKKLNGLDFDRQKIIGNYIVDFFCASKFLVIEIDDKTHDFKVEYDKARDEYLKSLHLNVIHVSAAEVLKNPHGIFLWLSNHPGTSCHPSTGGEPVLSDKHIRDFLDYLRPGDVVVFNNSRVIPARFDADGHEITLHTAVDDKNWWGLCKKFNKINIGDTLTMTDGTTITVMDKDDESGLLLRFNCDNVFDVLNRVGKMPLPPYMKRDAEIADQTRYQTVYADPLGSMAAPTAGLHFTDELMHEIEARGAKIVKITLHVGAGTWMPVKTENLSEHKMHSEWCQITPAQADIINAATRVIAVGTTTLRTLESAASSSPPLEGCLAVATAKAGGVVRDTANYRTLPFNPKLKERARKLRHAGSLPEALLWREISGKKINGLNFNRQTVIGNYIVDFFCPKTGLVIEIDDKASHDIKGAYDEKREKFLTSLGLTTLHITAADVLKDASSVASMIARHPGTSCHPSGQRGTCFGFQMNTTIKTSRSNSPLARGVAGGTRRGVAPRVTPFCGTTDIFITPGYKFRAVDVLLTNFHLPKSTLFMLVSAFSGLAEMKAAYAHAVAEKYRFFSYGDCCLLFRKDN